MRIAIHQPEHLPWLGFFHRAANVDVFVLLDSVQFRKGYFQNRNRIHTPQGLKWVTVPIVHKTASGPVAAVEINNSYDWRKKYVRALKLNYAKAPYPEIVGKVCDIVEKDFKTIGELNTELIKLLAEEMGLQTKFVSGSALGVTGKKNELLLAIAKKLGAREYLIGMGGSRDYIDEEMFGRAGIKLLFQTFEHPVYKPFNYKEFCPYPSIIDVIANLGIDKTKSILKGGQYVKGAHRK